MGKHYKNKHSPGWFFVFFMSAYCKWALFNKVSARTKQLICALIAECNVGHRTCNKHRDACSHERANSPRTQTLGCICRGVETLGLQPPLRYDGHEWKFILICIFDALGRKSKCAHLYFKIFWWVWVGYFTSFPPLLTAWQCWSLVLSTTVVKYCISTSIGWIIITFWTLFSGVN